MNVSPLDQETCVVLRRNFAASRERLFEAWTNPEHMKRWFGPSDEFTNPFIEIDLRVGGKYRIAFQKEGSDTMDIVGGTYREIRNPEKLVFTWTWEPPNNHAGSETLVTVELLDRGNETELVLTHERFPNAEMRDSHNAGWSGCFERLLRAV